MRLLHTSDWHLGRSLYNFSLLEDQRFFLDEVIALLQRERIGGVLIAGDIYDRPLPSGSAVQLYDYFISTVVGKLGIPVIAVAGNHDSASRLEFGSSLYRVSGYYIFGYPQKDISPVLFHDEYGDIAVYPIPYIHPADVRVLFDDDSVRTYDDAYRTLLSGLGPVDASARNIAVAHGFFSDLSGAGRKELVTSDSEVNIGGLDIADAACFSAFDYAALGHLHSPQWTVSGRARYSGAPMKYSLSEERREKSVTIVELGGKGDMAFTTVPIAARRDVRVITGAFHELCTPSFHKTGSFDDYVFAQIQGGLVLYPIEKLQVLFPNILGLSFGESQLSNPEITVNRQARLSEEELFCRFYRELKGEEIPEDRLSMLREAIICLEEDL